MKLRLTFIVTSLGLGGAEKMLLQLLRSLNRNDYDRHVITLQSEGVLEKNVNRMGISLMSAHMNNREINIRGFFRLLRFLRTTHPHLVVCWMYHANLLGGLVARMLGVPVVWSIRHDRLDPTLLKPRTIQIARLGAWLSKFIPRTIVFCAESSKQEHIRIGYDAKKSVVIPNGVDTNTFIPNMDARQLIRKELGIPYDALVIGHVGRFDPTKDHRTFISASKKLSSQEKVCFVLCGKDVDWENKILVDWIDQAGIKERTFLLGQRKDMPNIYATLDLFISSSVSESFPNVVGEAMSCGVPCAVTDVGDSSRIVGETGLVVPPGDPKALAEAAEIFLSNKDLRTNWGGKARSRIMENYSLHQFVKKYEELFTKLLLEKHR